MGFWHKEPKSQDIHLRLLVKLYTFLARRTHSTFNQLVLKRMFMSRSNQPPLSLSQMIWKMKFPGQEGKTAVVVGSITDDVYRQFCKAPGTPHSHTKHYVCSKGQKFERVRVDGGRIYKNIQRGKDSLFSKWENWTTHVKE
uniref:Large ribosomal subunit protein uL15/eL18 domain-containing protein n=1 Tax=Balaenoptera musculus TaxID=9771 RepID=A0A8C0DPN1_BALMU